MDHRRTKIIVTLGPASHTESHLEKMKTRGVDFVRVNMSHSSLEYLERCIELAHRVGIPFILDTEGSQVRTGDLRDEVVYFAENDEVRLSSDEIVGDAQTIHLRPGHVIDQLAPGDLIHIDFDTLILRVMDVSTAPEGHATARAIFGGFVGRNKAVVVDPVFAKKLDLPPLSPKDYESIELGLAAGIEHIAVSFVRSASSIEEARRATQGKMKIISKVESTDALANIDEIIERTDLVLIDRGDLSKEIPIEKIPFAQKVIIEKARQHDTGVFVATNLLETMIENRKPTRAEVQDVINTIIDGAQGLTLAAETAIGKHPLECINMLNRLILHAEAVLSQNRDDGGHRDLIRSLERSTYLVENGSASLIPPHGGHLVNRVLSETPEEDFLAGLPKVRLDSNKQMEVEQIAVGTYSPLEGFMGEEDFQAVLSDMRLADGTVWPLPITLDVARDAADRLSIGQIVALTDERNEVLALLHLSEKYGFDRESAAQHLFGTTDGDHPGVRMLQATGEVLLAGQVDLVKGRPSETRAYELTPKQVRKLFDERGWAKVMGFHTRNVIHRGHEFMQMRAMEEAHCDGVLVQPVVGRKKPGDFKPEYIIKSYELMMERFYPKDTVVCAAFATYSRYAGPREALFTALCRKNFGCSHFIVGRDHTGVGDFYDPYASHELFDRFPDLGMEIVRFKEVVYSQELDAYVEVNGGSETESDKHHMLSGTEARAMFLRGETPPDWFMRPEVAKVIVDAVNSGEQVFEEVG